MIILEYIVVAFLSVYCALLVRGSFPEKKFFNFDFSTKSDRIYISKLEQEIKRLTKALNELKPTPIYEARDPMARQLLRMGFEAKTLRVSLMTPIYAIGKTHANIDIMEMHKERVAREFSKQIAELLKNKITVTETDERVIFEVVYLHIV